MIARWGREKCSKRNQSSWWKIKSKTGETSAKVVLVLVCVCVCMQMNPIEIELQLVPNIAFLWQDKACIRRKLVDVHQKMRFNIQNVFCVQVCHLLTNDPNKWQKEQSETTMFPSSSSHRRLRPLYFILRYFLSYFHISWFEKRQ